MLFTVQSRGFLHTIILCGLCTHVGDYSLSKNGPGYKENEDKQKSELLRISGLSIDLQLVHCAQCTDHELIHLRYTTVIERMKGLSSYLSNLEAVTVDIDLKHCRLAPLYIKVLTSDLSNVRLFKIMFLFC